MTNSNLINSNSQIMTEEKFLLERHLPPSVLKELRRSARPEVGKFTSSDVPAHYHFDFNKEYTLKFMQALMEFPKEVRDNIYELVFLSESRPDFVISFIPEKEGAIVYDVVERQTGQELYKCVRIPYESVMQMDVLQHHRLVGFFAALLRFEGRTLVTRSSTVECLDCPLRKTQRDLGVFLDAVDAFWRRCQIHFVDGYPHDQISTSKIWLWSSVKHLSIDVLTICSNTRYYSGRNWNRDNWLKGHGGLINLFDSISKHFLALRTVVLRIRINQTEMEYIIDRPTKQPWLRYVKRIPVEHVNFSLFAYTSDVRPSERRSLDHMEAHERLTKVVGKVLEELLMPMSMIFKADEDFGLQKLFFED